MRKVSGHASDRVCLLRITLPTGRDRFCGRFRIYIDLAILDAFGYLLFSQTGCIMLFHLFSRLYEHTRVVIKTNLSFTTWTNEFGGVKMTKAVLDQIAATAISLIRATSHRATKPVL
jgi:DNA replication protein DnaC